MLARDIVRRAPEGQPAHSPGQSEAAPRGMNTVGSAFAPQGQKHK